MATNGRIWSELNSEPWCRIFCRIFDMAPHIGTFMMLIKASERCKRLCLPWPKRWAGPCYRMPRYYIHETIRLFLALFFYYQVWFQLWFAVGSTLIYGYNFSEHKVKRNIIPFGMLLWGITAYVVCWCGMFGRKQDGEWSAENRCAPEPPTHCDAPGCNDDDDYDNDNAEEVENANNNAMGNKPICDMASDSLKRFLPVVQATGFRGLYSPTASETTPEPHSCSRMTDGDMTPPPTPFAFLNANLSAPGQYNSEPNLTRRRRDIAEDDFSDYEH